MIRHIDKWFRWRCPWLHKLTPTRIHCEVVKVSRTGWCRSIALWCRCIRITIPGSSSTVKSFAIHPFFDVLLGARVKSIRLPSSRAWDRRRRWWSRYAARYSLAKPFQTSRSATRQSHPPQCRPILSLGTSLGAFGFVREKAGHGDSVDL